MDTKFVLIRHGESMANAALRYAGHSDFELSPYGIEQAEIAADYFKDEPFAAIYSSDLKRAYNTALPHAKMRSMDVIASEDLREVHVGEWEDVLLSEILVKWKQEFCVEWREKFGSCTPPGGESVYHAAKRMHDKLLSIAKEVEGEILVVTHAAVIRALWCYLHGVEPEKWAQFVSFPSNASASFLGFDGEKLSPLRFSFDDYLAGKKTFVVEA